MNIHFQNQVRESSNDNMNRVAGHEKTAGTQTVNSVFKVDISGRDKDINAFGMEDLMSGADVMNKAAVKDVTLEQNALAVMSNCMSSEDFAKLQKDGFSPDDMSAEETVTTLDKIKATLAQSGVVIPGYTDDLSPEEIEAITGSAAYAATIEAALRENQLPVSEENVRTIDEAIDAAGNVTSLSDNAAKYMITNDLPLTVNNLYKASHSYAEGGAKNSNAVKNPNSASNSVGNPSGQAKFYKDAAGYVGRNATDIDLSELKPQISKIIEEAGLELTEETMNSAKWLIERNVPLTADNLLKLQDLNSLSIPLDSDTVAKASAAAMADGINVSDAVLTNTESLVNKAARIMDEVSEQADTIKDTEISRHRQLEEVRLHMTVEANLQLLKKGIAIDTSDLQKLVEDLKQAEREYFAPFLMDESPDSVPADQIQKYNDELIFKIDLFRQTTAAVETFKTAPSDFVSELINRTAGEVSGEIRGASEARGIYQNEKSSEVGKNITLTDAVSKAEDFKLQYEKSDSKNIDFEKANKSYETMMTVPRRDMGDSIRKAFRNVDDILEDLDIEVTRLNEKAVRILGYAGIEINEENITSAAKAEVAVENIIANMTPARTLRMIRDGENPLNTDIYELSDRLVSENNEDADNSKYAEFLLRLEKSGEITDAEKKSFIGMYRLFRKIEKSDGKLIGDVLKADEMLTFNNIIAASRSDRQLGTDIRVDDSFGAIEKLVSYGESITDQILAGFRNAEENTESSAEKLSEIKQAANVENQILTLLDNVSEAHSPLNMAAAEMLVNSRGSLFKTIKNAADSSISGEAAAAGETDEAADAFGINEAIAEIQNSFDDEQSVKDAYESFSEKASEIIKNASENADTYIDIRSLKLASRQLTIVNKLAESRTYEIPVEIDGELTSINLKIINDSENAGKVNLSYATENTGKVKAEFTLRGGSVSGFVVTENSYFAEVFSEKEEAFTAEFKAAGIDVTSMYHTSSRGLSIDGNYTEKNTLVEGSTPETRQLYTVAKAIIKAVQK